MTQPQPVPPVTRRSFLAAAAAATAAASSAAGRDYGPGPPPPRYPDPDRFQGKPFNAPNDGVVHPDGGVWFTDPGYGALLNYEGNKGELLLKEAVYRIDPKTGKVAKVTDELFKPNGICFSPDYKKLYVA